MLEMQAAQRAAGGPKDGEIEYDDNFIYDNVSEPDSPLLIDSCA